MQALSCTADSWVTRARGRREDQLHGSTGRDSGQSGQFHTEAQFVSLTAGVVTLRKADGTTVKVPVEKLSEEDREWIDARRKESRRQ